jgi:iron complex outermembrane recepter protein
MRSGTTRLDRFSWSPIRAALVFAILAYLPAWPALAQSAQAADAVATFNIPAGDLAGALDRLSTQTGIQLMYQPGIVAGKQAKALSGRMTWKEALDRLLQDSGLAYGRVNATTIVIQRSGEGAKSDARPAAEPSSSKSTASEKAPVTDMKAMTVTGTRIRGGTTPSPVITIGAENIREEGFTDLGEVVRAVPQNFSGGQNPGVSSGATLGGVSNQNFGGGSALNLRGLGPDATLTLLNGRRLAYDGLSQAVDISSIPIEAVDRVEIVPDGASAIYGSDAVGGVANVITQRDFNGLALGARYGKATDGGLSTKEYTATAGSAWHSGGFIASWKKSSADPIFVDQRSYTRGMPGPNTIYPGIDYTSALLSVHQFLGNVAELQLDVVDTQREQTQYIDYPGFYYYAVPKTSVFLISPSVQFSLPDDWTLTVGGTYGKDKYVYKTFYVTSAQSTPWSNGCYCNNSHSYEVGAEGPLFELGGGDARMAVGVGQRSSEYLNRPYTSDDGYSGDGRSRYGYAEVNLPLVSSDSDMAGVHRLAFSAAVRAERYDSFGRVTTPKLGLIYDPTADFTLKASWGKSFKAPTLYQQYSERAAVLMAASMAGGNGYAPDATVLMAYGGNDRLRPERARTWTTSLALHPRNFPDLEAELTWFNIEYSDRVILPVGNYFEALSNPAYAQFIDYAPTPEQQAALLAELGELKNFAGAGYDSSKVVAIINDQYINVVRQRIRGFDLSGSYRFDLGASRLAIRGSASLLDSIQQASRGQPSADLSGTIFQPAKYRGRLGAVWSRGNVTATAFANYTSGVTSRLATPNEKTASFTTLDTTLRYDTGQHDSIWSDVAFQLAAQNLLDRKPPLYTTVSPSHVPYDSTNYSAIGRFLNVSVSKRW